jgi:subtilisin family serine protease
MRQRNVLIVGAIVTGLVLPISGTTGYAEGDETAPEKTDLASVPVVESTTGSYVVVMIDDPLIVDHSAESLDTPAVEAEAAQLAETHDEVLTESGISTDEKVQDYANALNGFSATLTYAQAIKIAGHPKVAAVLPDELRQPTTDSSGSYLKLDVRGGAWQTGLDGSGVVVGVIDTGIWPEHPSFADDGTYPATDPLPDALDADGNFISSGCEFGNTAHNPLDVPFECNDKLIGARQMLQTYRALEGALPEEFDSARDDAGHGTHTASTAAGNAGVEAEIFGKSLGEISGIAPHAQIIAYKALGETGGYSSDLAQAIDQAVADGVDVINYSLGGGPGLLGADAISLLFASDAGVFVAVSAGNEGDGPATIGGPADTPWVTSVAASTQDRFFRGTITLADGVDPGPAPRHGIFAIWQWWQKWFRYQNSLRVQFGASVTQGLKSTRLVDAEDAGNELCLDGEFDATVDLTGAVVLCKRGGNGRVEKGLAVGNARGAGMILYNASDTDNLFTDSHFVPSVHVDFSVGVKIKRYIDNHRTPMARISDTAKKTSISYDPSVTIFSSRGPNPTGADVIKPDIAAPGLQILAGYTPYPDAGEVSGENFVAIAGTSMSSPHIAGLLALVKQAHPDWSAAAAKSALMTTADPKIKDNDRSSIADPFDTGSGQVRPGKPANPSSMFNPGLVYDTDIFGYLEFLCGNGDGCFSGVGAVDPSDLNYPSIGVADLAGTQTVTRTITSVASKPVTWTANVQAPAGYTVDVNPATITLAPGESASFEVTINNLTGEVGVWSFGALTWKGSGGYTARSPIAVRASEVAVPAEVTGTGVDGTASIPIQFGYEGAYSATGQVTQDEDQTPFTEDDGTGLIQVDTDLTGLSVARWTMEMPDALGVDIDLYLLDADGNFLAQSTASGTHEIIELQDPPEGVVSLFIHGWQVPVSPVDFTLDQWLVPDAGGSLTVTAAPASAEVGAIGQIDVAWTGAPAPGVSLGAVTHSNESGVIGVTTVVIEN